MPYNSYQDFRYEYIVYYINYEPYFIKQEKKIRKNIEKYHILCVQIKSVILNNTIVDLFNKEYLNENKYYCGRTDLPIKNIFVEDRNCNNNLKKIFFIYFILFVFYKLSMLYIIIDLNYII